MSKARRIGHLLEVLLEVLAVGILVVFVTAGVPGPGSICLAGLPGAVSAVDWQDIIDANKCASDTDLRAHLNLAIAYANTGRIVEANDEFRLLARADYETFGRRVILDGEDSLRRDPKNIMALNHLAFTYYAFGRYAEALSCFRNLADLDSKNVWVKHYLAVAYARTGRLDDAISTLQKALDLDPRNEYTHLLLALAYKEKGWYIAAAIEFLKAPNARKEILNLK
ncbi:MAG TPA: tetratricopeptide repeat protein [Firmicutes bacterium]|nr:tetratricopeptide repeat protein [Bacillota bacterium]